MSQLSDLLALAANDAAPEGEVRAAAKKALEALDSFSTLPTLSLDIRGETFDVTVGRTGTFITEFMGTKLHAYTLEELRQRLLKATKQASINVSIPYTRLVRTGWRGLDGDGDFEMINGVARSIHARSRHIQVTEKGKAESLDHPSNTYRRLIDEEAQEVLRLKKACMDADKAFADYTKPLQINLYNQVNDEVREVLNRTPALEA